MKANNKEVDAPPPYKPQDAANKPPGPGIVTPPVGQPSTAVVIVQPTPVVSPNDYMGFSVVTFLCFCWPLGLAAIVFSHLSKEARNASDYESARTYGRIALGLDVAGVLSFIVLIIVIIAMTVA